MNAALATLAIVAASTASALPGVTSPAGVGQADAPLHAVPATGGGDPSTSRAAGQGDVGNAAVNAVRWTRADAPDPLPPTPIDRGTALRRAIAPGQADAGNAWLQMQRVDDSATAGN